MTHYKCTTENAFYVEKKERVEVTRRLKFMPSAQAGILVDDRGTHLMSYVTLVCTVDHDGWLTCTGTYSATTRKHIGAFIREIAPSFCYYDVKRCYENSEALNINTGEILTLAEYANSSKLESVA